MKFTNDEGSFTGFSISLCLLIGLALICGSLEWIENHFLRVLGFSIGLVAVAAAGYAGRAKALGLRSFGMSSWEKAKKSYEEDDKKE
jgi:uncharacterized membrane protein YoaK (UPF0700 family)